jgi:hypothetical protein
LIILISSDFHGAIRLKTWFVIIINQITRDLCGRLSKISKDRFRADISFPFFLDSALMDFNASSILFPTIDVHDRKVDFPVLYRENRWICAGGKIRQSHFGEMIVVLKGFDRSRSSALPSIAADSQSSRRLFGPSATFPGPRPTTLPSSALRRRRSFDAPTERPSTGHVQFELPGPVVSSRELRPPVAKPGPLNGIHRKTPGQRFAQEKEFLDSMIKRRRDEWLEWPGPEAIQESKTPEWITLFAAHAQ